MFRLFPYIIIAILVYLALLYMQTYQPDKLNELIVSADIFRITEISKYEHYREDQIKRLEGKVCTPRECHDIGLEEKQVLLNHTVFLGATAEMVEYALGTPKQVLFQEASSALYYVYFLAGDKRPTVFLFSCTQAAPQCKLHENYRKIFTLSKAYKKSTIDIENLNVQETPETPPVANVPAGAVQNGR